MRNEDEVARADDDLKRSSGRVRISASLEMKWPKRKKPFSYREGDSNIGSIC